MQTQLPASVANLTKPTRYISTTDTAKLIRQALREAFPEIRFSVRSDTYSGGSSIRVRWTDGPKQKAVDEIARAFQGGGFDGMTDSRLTRRHTLNGEPVNFGGDFVFCNRDITDARVDEATQLFGKLDRESWWRLMQPFGLSLGECSRIIEHSDTPKQVARTFLHNVHAAKFDGRKSPLADSVTFMSET